MDVFQTVRAPKPLSRALMFDSFSSIVLNRCSTTLCRTFLLLLHRLWRFFLLFWFTYFYVVIACAKRRLHDIIKVVQPIFFLPFFGYGGLLSASLFIHFFSSLVATSDRLYFFRSFICFWWVYHGFNVFHSIHYHNVIPGTCKVTVCSITPIFNSAESFSSKIIVSPK